MRKKPDWLTTEFILAYFDKSQPVAQKKYRQFVEELTGIEHASPLQHMVAATMLGSPEFVAAIQEQHLDGKSPDRNLPALKQLKGKPSIDQILEITGSVIKENEKLATKVAIYLCHRYSGAKLKEIGKRFGVKESAVSQSSRRLAVEQGKDKKLQIMVTDLVKRFRLCNV